MTEDINKCIEVLKAGGIILYPTDTVWGLGCDATNEEAVKKIYTLKQREDSKSMIVIVANDGMLQKHVQEVPELAWDIIDLATKPTTIIYPGAKNLAKNVISSDGSIAIRVIKDGFCNQLVHKF
ncbi:MAG: Sua5/YciO/YrdC/YwlC family protein, partial [Flavobacteriales bacterium]|nr:Sua5/YciO/YrdC/YwlC family protein [Flavobacteriales bacterium]